MTNKTNYTIVITGLGGQGLIRFLQILGDSLVRKGYKVMTSETHGLSQRGGKVTCFIRFGERVAAPIPMIGSADMLIATEKASIMNVLEYVRPDRKSKLILTDYEKKSQNSDYPSEEYLIKLLNEFSNSVWIVPAMKIVEKLKNLKIINAIIIGYVLRFLPITKQDVLPSINQQFRGNVLELNHKAFAEGLAIKSPNKDTV